MKGKRLLLVDDDPKNIKILRESFSLAEFDVDFAPSDIEAFTKIEMNPPDVIVTELAPPKIDGYRLLEQVERNPKTADVPVIFLTKKSDVWNRVKSFKLGAKDYIVKPLHVKEIVARINMVLNRIEKRKTQEAEEKRKHTGRLEDLSVIDLIESLGVKRKSGVLTLTNENGKTGQIFFSEGSIINATCGTMVSEDAVYQMVPWRKGRFTIVFKQVDVPDEISVSNLGLLMQAAKRMEQREKILALLPASDCVFTLSDTFKKIISKKGVNPELEKFVNLFDGVNDISRIIDASDYDDLRTLERINKLYKLGFLEVRDNGVAFEPQTNKTVTPAQDSELEESSRKVPVTNITVAPRPIVAPDLPQATVDQFPGTIKGDNGDIKEERKPFEPILPAETSIGADRVVEPFSTEREAENDEHTEPDQSDWTESDSFRNLDLLNEKVTEESLLNQEFFYSDSWIQPAASEAPEPAETEAMEQTIATPAPTQAQEEKFPELTPEQPVSDLPEPGDISLAFEARDLDQPLPVAEESAAVDQTTLHQRLEHLEKNYPFEVYEHSPAQEETAEPEPQIPEIPLPSEPGQQPEPLEGPRMDLPVNKEDSGKKFGLGSRSDREASLNQLIREVMPDKRPPAPMPEPSADRLAGPSEEPVQQPLSAPVTTEPVPKPAKITVPPILAPAAPPKPLPEQLPTPTAPVTETRVNQGTITTPSASKAHKEQPNIMIVTNDNQIRTETINALTGGDYLTHSLGGTSLTDVHMGSVQFKGGRSLNILGITTEKEFKPVVDYLSSRILGYIFLINASRVSNWNYLGYLANTLNNKLNLPALILIYWDSTQGNWNEATIRARLGLLEGQKMSMISEINSKTARRAIFSLFGVTKNVEGQES